MSFFAATPILYRGKGCEQCGGTGYRGRVAIHELLVGSDAIKRLIYERKPITELRRQARAEGMTTLLQDGLEKMAQGLCDLRQVHAVCIE
ncbi:MAG: hypothetical protein HYV63_06915 [Candidatus Schekmanbacteria bacterium]|nr:hypothetical protein [Candidatus Schekmanbacteria bacterium]